MYDQAATPIQHFEMYIQYADVLLSENPSELAGYNQQAPLWMLAPGIRQFLVVW